MIREKITLTGDRLIGRSHIGHYVGLLRHRVELQSSGPHDEIFMSIADAQALTNNMEDPEKVHQNVTKVAPDHLVCGLDPAEGTVFIQSQISELCEFTFYYMDLVTVSRLRHNPTMKTEIQMRNLETNIPIGFFAYPISQAVDITAFRATTVPVGEGQEPMIEQAHEIIRRSNSIYGDTLVEPEILLLNNAACLRLPGTDGKAKTSRPLNDCIYLSDTVDEAQKKVKSMYTDPNRLCVQDSDKIEDNTVLAYLGAFCHLEHPECYLPDYFSLEELKAHYQRGGLGDTKVKGPLNNVMQETLEPIRNRRKELEEDTPAIYEMLRKGCGTTRKTAAAILDDACRTMKINCFDGAELIAEQVGKLSAG